VVPEPEHTIAAGFENRRPCGIVFDSFGMLAAIQFNDQFGFETEEIGDVTIDRVLTAELKAAELAAAQDRP